MSDDIIVNLVLVPYILIQFFILKKTIETN